MPSEHIGPQKFCRFAVTWNFTEIYTTAVVRMAPRQQFNPVVSGTLSAEADISLGGLKFTVYRETEQFLSAFKPLSIPLMSCKAWQLRPKGKLVPASPHVPICDMNLYITGQDMHLIHRGTAF